MLQLSNLELADYVDGEIEQNPLLERTEGDGVLHREILGVYFNYDVTFGPSLSNPADYDRLFEKLSEPEEFHSVQVPYGTQGTVFTFEAYISGVKDEMLWLWDSKGAWTGLTAKFIAKKPART